MNHGSYINKVYAEQSLRSLSPMQVSPVETLDLEEIACRTVSVSFAVINKFGVSRESPPLILTVPGGLYDIYRVLVVIVYICKKVAVGNLAVQGTGAACDCHEPLQGCKIVLFLIGRITS